MYLNPDNHTTTSRMRRSKTTYTPQSRPSKVLDPLAHIRKQPRNTMKVEADDSHNAGFSQCNASWDAPTRKTSSRMASIPGIRSSTNTKKSQKSKSRSLFLPSDNGIEDLLNMLRTTEFAGEIDPEAHAEYLKEPMTLSQLSPMRANKKATLSKFKSDGHLLKRAAK